MWFRISARKDSLKKPPSERMDNAQPISPDFRAAWKTLAEGTHVQMGTLLGAEAGEAYARTSRWVTEVEKGVEQFLLAEMACRFDSCLKISTRTFADSILAENTGDLRDIVGLGQRDLK